ncbi:hypothetical protein DFH09DRAFT_1199724 [Mycena vulgaris]|nr:hypothetical protein DFH09DRAFT_277401 [Mycena vulgaris]KAJ6507583.1 hypothetical protein DFH09DRAFT_1199724 [Mycena vulgaris]
MDIAQRFPSVDGSLGAIEIGLVLGTFLFGILTLQTFNYYGAYPTDSKWLKGLVTLVWSLELSHAIASWHAAYLITVTFYGQPEHILTPPHSLELVVGFSGALTMVVQTFFAFRVRVLSSRWPLTMACCALNVLAFIFSIIIVVTLWRSGGLSVIESKARWLMITNSTLVPATNILITSSLCYYLWKIQKSQNRFKKTRTMVVTVMIWTIETTIITSAASILQLILFLARKDFVWTTFFLLHAKLLSNCMLASLNGRKRLRSGTSDVGITNGDTTGGRDRSVTVIHMDRVTETYTEGGHSKAIAA